MLITGFRPPYFRKAGPHRPCCVQDFLWASRFCLSQILALRVPAAPLSLCNPFKVFPWVFCTPVSQVSPAHHFSLCKHIILNKQTKKSIKNAEAISALYCLYSLLLCLGMAFFFFFLTPSPKGKHRKIATIFTEVKTNLYDLNKTISTEVREYPPPRSC